MNLSQNIVNILAEELGPSAPSFLKKQCKNIGVDADGITKDDLEELAKNLSAAIKKIVGNDISQKIYKEIISLK